MPKKKERVDPREEADKYIEQHTIMQLFGDLGTRLIHDRPADPNAYLLDVLKQQQEGKCARFFSEANVATMFSMFDVNGVGFITPDQYKQALHSLGIENPKIMLPPKVDKVDKQLFAANINKELGR